MPHLKKGLKHPLPILLGFSSKVYQDKVSMMSFAYKKDDGLTVV